MGIELGYLAALSSDMLYLKALMGRIAASSGVTGTASFPTVDFVCDMFDRTDQPVLDGYWSGTGANSFSIVNGRVVQQTSVVFALASIEAGTSVANSSCVNGVVSNQSYQRSVTSSSLVTTLPTLANLLTAPLAEYGALMSSSDMNIKITVDVSAALSNSPAVVTNTTDAGTWGPNLAFTSAQTQFVLPASVGADVWHSGSSRYLGMTATVACAPGISVPGSATSATCTVGAFTGDTISNSAAGISVPATGFISGTFSDYVSFVTQAVPARSAAINSGGSSPTVLGPNFSATALAINAGSIGAGSTGLVSPGSMTFLFTAQGNQFSMAINGVTAFSITSVLMPSRNRVGLRALPINILSMIQQNGMSVSGISSFKAWVNSMPEPVSQTGRGTLVGGALVYNDRYHTTAADGSVTYNPLA